MLAVALLDSLDSTLGTRPGASREAREDGEMSAIPEGVIPQNVDNDKERDANRDDDHGYKNEDDYYQDHSGYKTCGPKFVVDGRLTLDAEEKRGPDSMTTRGATLKTTTGRQWSIIIIKEDVCPSVRLSIRLSIRLTKIST